VVRYAECIFRARANSWHDTPSRRESEGLPVSARVSSPRYDEPD